MYGTVTPATRDDLRKIEITGIQKNISFGVVRSIPARAFNFPIFFSNYKNFI
ncbi:MAG: hypothetical protein P8Y70_08045 [Candidatus Lokiarchaeota archaeon]